MDPKFFVFDQMTYPNQVFSLRQQGKSNMDFNPEKLEVRQLIPADLSSFIVLIHLFNKVFEEDASAIGNETTLLKLLRDKGFIAVVAFYENEPVGGLTAYELPRYYSENSEIFLYDLAV